ncbi:MAG: S46 family peptidase [Pirellulaceae bacterium]|nr:S46 family peptidase [Pirellulaceae bacterium]
MGRWLLILLFLVPGSFSALADEGMWLFSELPTQHLQTVHSFVPPAGWAEHLMKSSVRFNVGGSASFVSSQGLVLTNHHVASDTLFKLSNEKYNYLQDGFLAHSRSDELKAPDLELNQLVSIQDVTQRVQNAVTKQMSTSEAVAARRAVIAEIEKESLDQTGLRSDVVTLFGGGRYHLYRYKRYTDVRLVWAPESAIAFFGGDADNFEYPRFCLDACLMRVYENDQPAKIEHYLRWSAEPLTEGELVFVSGNPGRTNRIYTTAALKYLRDHRMPYVLNMLRRREIALQQFSLRGVEHARRAKDDLFGVQNSRKAYLGMLGGLQDPQLMQAKQQAEERLIATAQADTTLAQVTDAIDSIAGIVQQRSTMLGKDIVVNSQLFHIARTIVELVAEDQKPSGERLHEYADAGRASLEQQLYSAAPIYADLESWLIADSLSSLLEARGADDPLCQQIMHGMSPADRAADLVARCQLADFEARKRLVHGGPQAVAASTDAMIELARLLDADHRRYRKQDEDLNEQEKQAYAKIAEALFKINGTSTYPDATFTLRLAYGTVQGYQQAGMWLAPWTTMGGTFEHEAAHRGQADFVLPESWKISRDKIDPSVQFNFVSTADIIGGNSGSPVVNRAGELVGLIFDGNIQSLTANYTFDDRQMRATSVSGMAIKHALQRVYGADKLASELGN